MPERVAYEESYTDGSLDEVTVTLTNGETSLDLSAEPNGSGLVLTRAYQHDTTLLEGEGFSLLREGIEALREHGHDINARGLVNKSDDTLPQEWDAMSPVEIKFEAGLGDEAVLGDLEDRLQDTELDPVEIIDEIDDSREYDSVKAYLQAVDEATVEEMAEATGQSTDGVHKELFEIPDERLNKRKDPDDGRRKLYSLQESDGSPPGVMTEGEIVSVADYYTTLSEVAKDLEVSEDRARAILREHDVFDEVEHE